MNSRRLDAIKTFLQTQPYCKMEELAQRFDVSLATIHRDVIELVKNHQVQKVHGGVVSLLVPQPETSTNANGGHFLQRMEMKREAKMEIAETAEKEIENGDIVFVDSSTTGMFLARRLQESRLTNLSLITNSVLVAQEFHRFPPYFVLVCIGGNYNANLNSFLGRLALENLRHLQINKAFISCAGIAGGRLTTYYEDHATFLKGVMQIAKQTFLLIDKTKYDKTGLYDICGVDEVTKVLSEA